jgi:hypothetical protein
MKTLVILIVTLLSVALPGLTSAEVLIPKQDQLLENKRNSEELVKATFYNGILIPVVDLPQVEIIDVRQGTQILKGNLKNGQLVLEVNLPSVEISANRTGSNTLRGEIRNGSFVGIVELPVIEIVSAMPLNKMTPVTQYALMSVPVIELKEIIITAPSQSHLVEAVMYGGKLIPLVNLPIVEITPRTNYLVSNVVSTNTFTSPNLQWFYTSLVNYGIETGNKVICEIYSTDRNPFQILGSSSR